MVVKLSWFAGIGGLNPSLARGFQDIDLCLMSDRVFYFGKDKFLYHDESVSLILGDSTEDEKVAKHHAQLFECGVLWQKLHPYASFMKEVIFKNVKKSRDALPPKDNAGNQAMMTNVKSVNLRGRTGFDLDSYARLQAEDDGWPLKTSIKNI